MRSYSAAWKFLCVVLIIFLLQTGSAQSRWSVPQLHELGWKADRIANGSTPLSSAERKAVAQIVGRDIRACLRDPGLDDPTTFEGYINSLRIKRIRLDDAGLSGLVVQGNGDCMCGATGNCNFWLIAERPSGFDVVLRTIGIQSFEIKKTMANGYFDVVLGSHDSATRTDLGLYHYTGTYYRRAACALMSYDGPNWTVLKTPHITPQKCE